MKIELINFEKEQVAILEKIKYLQERSNDPNLNVRFVKEFKGTDLTTAGEKECDRSILVYADDEDNCATKAITTAHELICDFIANLAVFHSVDSFTIPYEIFTEIAGKAHNIDPVFKFDSAFDEMTSMFHSCGQRSFLNNIEPQHMTMF